MWTKIKNWFMHTLPATLTLAFKRQNLQDARRVADDFDRKAKFWTHQVSLREAELEKFFQDHEDLR
jgi:hypothetical protein